MAEPVAGEDPNAPPDEQDQQAEDPKAKAARYRSIWSDEYRTLKRGVDLAVIGELDGRWAAEGESTLQRARTMRSQALHAAGNDLHLAYEALKAEAKTLAGAHD